MVPEQCLDLGRAIFLSPIGVLHHERPRLAQHHVVGEQSGTDGAPSVAGRRLHVDLLERRLSKDLGVGHAVERYSAGHA